MGVRCDAILCPRVARYVAEIFSSVMFIYVFVQSGSIAIISY